MFSVIMLTLLVTLERSVQKLKEICSFDLYYGAFTVGTFDDLVHESGTCYTAHIAIMCGRHFSKE